MISFWTEKTQSLICGTWMWIC